MLENAAERVRTVDANQEHMTDTSRYKSTPLAALRRDRADRLRAKALRICEEIVDLVHPETVLLVGSVARGDARDSSDIDLIVVGRSDRTFKERVDMLYSSLAFEHETDVYWYTPAELTRLLSQHNSFVRDVLTHAEPIYGEQRVGT